MATRHKQSHAGALFAASLRQCVYGLERFGVNTIEKCHDFQEHNEVNTRGQSVAKNIPGSCSQVLMEPAEMFGRKILLTRDPILINHGLVKPVRVIIVTFRWTPDAPLHLSRCLLNKRHQNSYSKSDKCTIPYCMFNRVAWVVGLEAQQDPVQPTSR